MSRIYDNQVNNQADGQKYRDFVVPLIKFIKRKWWSIYYDEKDFSINLLLFLSTSKNFGKCEFFPKEKKEERRTHFHKLKGKNWWINQLGFDT